MASRDRSNIYREGLAKGAPGATQVAAAKLAGTLLRNLALTLEEYLLQKRPILQKVAAPEAASEEKDDPDDFASGPIMPNRPRNHDRKIEEAALKRHERLVEQWRSIRHLYLTKADLRNICRQLGISARTVYCYKDLTEPPPAYKRKASVLDPYIPYLVARWNEGCHNGKRLYREIREQGYANSEEICARFTAQLRRAEARGKQPSSVPQARQAPSRGSLPRRRPWLRCSCVTKRSSTRNRKRISKGFARRTKLSPTRDVLPRSSPRWSEDLREKTQTSG